MEMVAFEALEDSDFSKLRRLIKNHSLFTNSPLAKRILEDWNTEQNYFVKVMPTDYKLALQKSASELNVNFEEILN
jgi:glutamate synthase (ferredoxin)